MDLLPRTVRLRASVQNSGFGFDVLARSPSIITRLLKNFTLGIHSILLKGGG